MSNMTQEYLKTLMTYDPLTGEFTRKINWGGSGKPGSIVGKKTTNVNTYKRVAIKGKTYYLHRLAFLYMTGSIPEEVDHKDRDRSNNKWSNLVASTAKDNAKNKSQLSSNTSGYTGVVWVPENTRWKAQITVNGKVLTKNFIKKEQAIAQRKLWEKEYNFYHETPKEYIQITMPCYYTQTFKTKKDKTFLVGMNWLRTAHHYIQNKVKQDYSDLLVPLLQKTGFTIKGRYEVAYEYYYKNKTSDLLNVGALMSKYFLDAAQKAGVVEEDNIQYCIKESFYVKTQDKENPRIEVYVRALPEKDDDESDN